MEVSENVKDYRDVESRLRKIASKYGKESWNNSPFKGTNFLTREIVCRKRLWNGIWYEISYGNGIKSGWMVGVTFMKGTESLYDLSTCCHEFSEVEEILEKASKLENVYK